MSLVAIDKVRPVFELGRTKYSDIGVFPGVYSLKSQCYDTSKEIIKSVMDYNRHLINMGIPCAIYIDIVPEMFFYVNAIYLVFFPSTRHIEIRLDLKKSINYLLLKKRVLLSNKIGAFPEFISLYTNFWKDDLNVAIEMSNMDCEDAFWGVV